MAKEIISKTITLSQKGGTFSTILDHFKGRKDENEDIANLRKVLSNERAKILHIIKAKQPESIYELAKLLGRDFKAVRQDIRLLEQFGLVELIISPKHGRDRLRPVIDIDRITINIEL